jgi:DNA-binding response OmpR family regulator
MRILVVDDDLALSDVIAFTLRRAGFEVITSHDGVDAYERWRTEAPDLVVLDIKLPGMDGLTLCKRFRAQRGTPVIILSIQGADEDVVNGLETGADDYIAKPFSPAQLVARVRAVLRRAGITPTPGKLTSGELTLDVARREVKQSDQKLCQLTQMEARLLEILMQNSDQVMPYSSLIARIWGIDGGDRVMLKQLVHRLRQKIEPKTTSPNYLETVPGVGYVFVHRSAEWEQ